MQSVLLLGGLASAFMGVASIAAVGCSSASSGSPSNSISSIGSISSSGGDNTGDDAGGGAGDDGTGSSSGTPSASSGAGSSSTGSSGAGSSGTTASSGGGTVEPPDAGPAHPTDAGVGLTADGGTVEDYAPNVSDFDCLKNSEWTIVGVSRYKNVLGHDTGTLAAARSAAGGTFPVGTFVQLVPNEAMVKRGKGYSAASDDWEFFALDTSATGTTISMSGGTSAVTNFVGSCLGCHGGAKPQFDLVCGDADGGSSHGCAPLPLSGQILMGTADPRCP
jgi:hypothetical protein